WKKTAAFLDDMIVTSVLHDNENNYWFTTIGEGVFFIPSINVMSYTIDDGLPGKTIYSLAEDDAGNIWMGFDDLRYGIIKDNEFFKTQLMSYKPVLRKRITNIMIHSDGSVWLAGDNGVFRISENDTSVIYHRVCKFILEGFDNNVWLSTVYGTISFNKESEYLFKNIEKNDKLIKLRINRERTHALCFDSNNNLLLGTNNGLKIFDGDTILCYPYDDPLLKRRITGIQLSKKGAIWFSTYGWGIGILKNDSLITLTIEDGLTSNICNSLYLDDDDNAWVATNKGLNKISFFSDSTIEIKTFTTRDGLVSNDINAVLKKGDTVWVATAKGLSYFEEGINKNKPPPKVYITKFQVSDKDSFITSNNNTFPYSFNNISIEYAGISFYSRGDVLYKYKLTGTDTSWNYTRSTIVEYPSLLPGEYQFIVNAANADGIWSIEPEQISFIIEKPFWLKWWFLLLEALSLSILISIVIYYVVVRINIKEQKKLSVKVKLAEAEQKALRAQMNPHFIFNSLNTIQGFIIENDKKTAYIYLEKFGSLIRKTLENSRERSIPVKKELETLELYLELEKKRFEEKFDYVFDIDPQIDTNNIMIPPMIFQPIVENAIKHGIMPGKTKGKIVIGVKKGKGKIICSVQDNGIGREKAARLNANQLKQHKSLGLQITQERIELFSSTLQDDQTMNITDLKNDTGESAGTRVEINIPVDYEL
ncbi:MAG: histidine kinase, partial [Bacteroidetes bacterium]|nr:histidine kinase [Bacteroidota bacterium]